MSKATKGYTLTDGQRAAVGVLLEGGTAATAAAAAGVELGAVREWMRRDPAFRAELNARRQEAWDANAARLRELVPVALDVLNSEMDGPRRLQAALAILKAAGLSSLDAPTGLTDPAAIEVQDEQDAKLAELMRY